LERDKCWLFELGAVVMVVVLLGGTPPAPATNPAGDADRDANTGDGTAGVDVDGGSRVCTVGVGLGVLAAWLRI